MLLVSSTGYAQINGGNSIGGQYASQAMAAVARVDDETAPFLNPAGLSKITRDSISSGASAYSFFNIKNGEREEFTTNNTTAHASSIERFESFNFGFIVYTATDSQDSSESNNSGLNDQNYYRLSNSRSSERLNGNIFSFAFAPHQSSWGIALNITDITLKSSNNSIQHDFSASASGRKWQVSNDEINLVQQSIYLSFGHQFEHKSHHFGFIVRTAGFLINNSVDYKQEYLNVTGKVGSDVVINQYAADNSLKDRRKKATPESVQLGYTYITDKWAVETNLMIEGAGDEIQIDAKDFQFKLNRYDTADDDYENTNLKADSSGDAKYTRSRVIPSIGFQYKATEKDIWGLGARYTKTNDIQSEGTNDLALTFGYTRFFKNFKGSYAFQYDRAYDTGHNEKWDNVSQQYVKKDLTAERFSLVLAGSYFF